LALQRLALIFHPSPDRKYSLRPGVLKRRRFRDLQRGCADSFKPGRKKNMGKFNAADQ
jgi:hypothetical protein